jgi:hypothetical protein
MCCAFLGVLTIRCNADTIIQEGGQVFVGNVTAGVIWFCENGVNAVGYPCVIDPNDKSDMLDANGNHTGISDEFLFATGFDCLGNAIPSFYGIGCSDLQPVADNDDGPALIFAPNLVVLEPGIENGVEKLTYIPPPGSGLPGAPPAGSPAIVYQLISDVPEPGTLRLLCVGFIALSFRTRIRSGPRIR